MSEFDIAKLAWQLDHDEGLPLRDLAMAAFEGQDISLALPALYRQLRRRSPGDREEAARILTNHWTNMPGGEQEVRRLLCHSDLAVERAIYKSLANFNKPKAWDIELLWIDFGHGIHCVDETIRMQAAKLLMLVLLRHGRYEGVQRLLENTDSSVEYGAAYSLVYHWETNDFRRKVVCGLVAVEDPDFKQYEHTQNQIVKAARLYLQVAREGSMVSIFSTYLTKLMELDARMVFAPDGFNSLDPLSVFTVAKKIFRLLESFIRVSVELRELQTIQDQVESAFLLWHRRNFKPARSADHRVDYKDKYRIFQQFLFTIAHRKAELAKTSDGELLAGETIPLPPKGDKRGMYATVRARI